MLLKKVELGPFRSINTVQTCTVDEFTTVLVGMNEAGKTVFLQGIHKALDALNFESFDVTEDYPRKDLTSYNKKHASSPANAITLTYQPSIEEITLLNNKFPINLDDSFTFDVSINYNNKKTISIEIDDAIIMSDIIQNSGFSSDTKANLQGISGLRELVNKLHDLDLNENEQKIYDLLNERISKTNWDNVFKYEIYQTLKKFIPATLYFSDYDLLPEKININDLKRRVQDFSKDPTRLEAKHKAMLALLRMADIEIDDLTDTNGYESLKAKIEGVSNSITDQIMEFWKQNENLEVVVDIQKDSTDIAPFNDGDNIYLRIKNTRHRVTTSFEKRSRGFIWFFSFLVWFDSVQYQINSTNDERKLILLLDEPALALHAMAQSDFLEYINHLSNDHQVLYTTHSPFMIESSKLHNVRMIEDKEKIGTVITDNLSGTDPRTIFPLQAALGWNIAQNLFISKRNFLVEGPSELIYLKQISNILEMKGREYLNDDITIVPTGGLDKIITFIALLGANNLNIAVLHDHDGKSNQKLDDLVKNKLIQAKSIKTTSMYLDEKEKPSDVEDLLGPELYLKYFNKTFSGKLNLEIKESELPPGSRIVDRLNRYLKAEKISLRNNGGFNHYSVASTFGSNPPTNIKNNILDRFEKLFRDINNILDE